MYVFRKPRKDRERWCNLLSPTIFTTDGLTRRADAEESRVHNFPLVIRYKTRTEVQHLAQLSLMDGRRMWWRTRGAWDYARLLLTPSLSINDEDDVSCLSEQCGRREERKKRLGRRESIGHLRSNCERHRDMGSLSGINQVSCQVPLHH